MRQSIRFGVLGARAIGQGKLEVIKEKRPSGLSGIQSIGSANILKVLMVSL